MRKITIQKMFSSNNEPLCGGKMDIRTLFRMNDPEYNPEIDTKDLLIGIDEKKEKVKKFYNRTINNCWENIKSANKYGIKEIIYDIPEYCDILDYDYNECMRLLIDTFKQKELDIEKISKTKVIISWEKYIAKNS